MAYTETGPSELQDDLFDLRMSEEARPLYDQVKAFVSEVAIPHY